MQTNFKKNILMALAPNGSLLQVDFADTCWDCIRAKLETRKAIKNTDVYIIGLKHNRDITVSPDIIPFRAKISQC